MIVGRWKTLAAELLFQDAVLLDKRVGRLGLVSVDPASEGGQKELQGEGWVCDPLNQIHDDLLWEVSDGLLPVMIPLFKGTMEGAVRLSVPVLVESKVGKSWGALKKWENGKE